MAKFNVKFWGVRGSLPAPKSPDSMRDHLREVLIRYASENAKTAASASADPASSVESVDKFVATLPSWMNGGFGGETSCVEIEGGETRIIIDAGSGLRRLGEKLMKGPCGKGQGRVHLFFTHFHWDHLIGLPFFAPVFVPGNQIHLYAVQPELEMCVRRLFERPFFPVSFEVLGAKIHFHSLAPRTSMKLGVFEITPYQLDHPDPCWGYRIEAETTAGRKSYAHCVDSETTRVSREELGEDLKLYQSANLCFFDAQYTLTEFLTHMSWGHSAAPLGLEIGLREGVEKIVFAHHDPAASDRKIADAERQTRDFYDAYRAKAKQTGRHVPEIEWQFAHDGDSFDLGELKSS